MSSYWKCLDKFTFPQNKNHPEEKYKLLGRIINLENENLFLFDLRYFIFNSPSKIGICLNSNELSWVVENINIEKISKDFKQKNIELYKAGERTIIKTKKLDQENINQENKKILLTTEQVDYLIKNFENIKNQIKNNVEEYLLEENKKLLNLLNGI